MSVSFLSHLTCYLPKVPEPLARETRTLFSRPFKQEKTDDDPVNPLSITSLAAPILSRAHRVFVMREKKVRSMEEPQEVKTPPEQEEPDIAETDEPIKLPPGMDPFFPQFWEETTTISDRVGVLVKIKWDLMMASDPTFNDTTL